MQNPSRSLERVICFSLLCLIMGCAATGNRISGPTSDAANDQMLRVGVCANSPPLIFKQDRRITGLEAELANALAQEMGKSLRFVEFKWDELIPALLDKKIDIIMSGMSITQARQVRMTFSTPYLTVGQMALVRGENIKKYSNAPAIIFCKETVGTEKATTGEFLVQRRFRNAQNESFNSPERAAKALVNGKIEMLIHDAPVVWWLASVQESQGLVPVPIFLTEEQLAWGLRYEDVELQQITNAFLKKWRGNARLEGTIKRWIPYMR